MKFKTRLHYSNSLIDLTPVVDVVFLLLVFFIVTSNILPLKSLSIENPQISKNSASLTTQLLVVMDAQNVIFLGPRKDIVDLVSLKSNLLNKMSLIRAEQAGVDPSIVLSIDRRVSYDAFLKLFSIVQDCSSKVRLVYKPLEEGNSEILDTVRGDV